MAGSDNEYDDDLALTNYVWNNYYQLMTGVEK